MRSRESGGSVSKRPSRALILLGHGSHYHRDSSAPTHFHADEIRRRGLFDEVLAAFWKEEPNLCHALDLVRSEHVYVIPFFISNGYFTEQVIPRELEVQGRQTFREGRQIFYGEPVGSHPSMTQVLLRCAETVLAENGGTRPLLSETTLVVVGHGTTKNENSAEAVRRQVRLLEGKRIYAKVLPAFVEEEPFDRTVLEQVKTAHVIVVPFFISDGLHSREDIPVRMGFASKGRAWQNPVLHPCGKGKLPTHLWYSKAVGLEPSMIDVVLDRVRELELEKKATASPSSKGAPVQSAWGDDLTVELCRRGEMQFGQLLLTKEGGSFSIRHVSDRGTPVHCLNQIQRIEDAHEWGDSTATGEYRPLRSARNLRGGWFFEGLSSGELRLAIDLFYPAAIVHQKLQPKGRLRIRSFEEVAARQTELYATVRDLPHKQVGDLARKLCGGLCVRHPLWPIRPGDLKPVIIKDGDAGSEAIPCPEPCSYWITCARSAMAKS